MTRERIIEAATDLIARNGVAGTNTEQVRAAAGVSGSQLYHYFESKQALIRAVITRQADSIDSNGGTPSIGALDSFDALEAWADAALERQSENDGRGQCTLNSLAGELSGGDEDSRAELSSGFTRWTKLLRSSLATMRERGELRADADIDTMAYVLLAALQGGSQLSQTLHSTAPMRASLTSAIAFVRSFATPDTPNGAAPDAGSGAVRL